MKYPAGDIYEIQYARYFKRGPEGLLEGIDLKGKTFLDLCGGTGRMSVYANEQGADVTYVDQESAMMKSGLQQLLGNRKIHLMEVSEALWKFNGYMGHGFSKDWLQEFDIVACQQAINYWLNREAATNLAKIVKDKFVFNTFNTMPSKSPVVKEYNIGELKYVEVSQLINGYVHHHQFCDGYHPHTTIFRWISREEYQKLLSPHFDLEERVDGPTSIWICSKRK